MRCIYCTYNQVLEGSQLRLRSPSEVVDEIEEAFYQFNPEAFEFVDSVFNDPVDHCREILEEIIRRPWKARLTTMGVSPKNLDPQFLQLMQRAGFTSFMISPESASDTMLTNYQKGFDLGDVRRAAEAINQFSFPVLWYFLVGGPGETRRTLQETLNFIERYLVRPAGPPHNLANIFLGVRIYPGTKLWHLALEEGLIHDQSNPLRPLWYLSRQLDLDRTMRQLYGAACRRPEIALGDMEKYLPLSKIFGVTRKIFPFPKPYWQHLLWIHQILVKLGVRSLFQARGVPAQLREYLKHQRKQSAPLGAGVRHPRPPG
jgi:radical SAM superfamily enzyme YgiQ (UPF0313 family)